MNDRIKLPQYEPGMEFTLDLARQMVAAAIAEKGANHKYVTPAGTCSYLDPVDWEQFHTGDGVNNPRYTVPDHHADAEQTVPGCVFGHALVAMGAPKEALLKDNVESISNLLTALRFAKDEVALRYANEVQAAQDTGKTWGEAAELGEREIEHYLPDSQSD